MTPFGDFIFFGLLLYAVVPTILLGLLGKAGRWWLLFVTMALLAVQFADDLAIRPGFEVGEIWIVCGYAIFEGAVAWAFLRWKARVTFWIALLLAILPLAVSKVLPLVATDTIFGFLGISYVTFRAIDVVLCIQDGLIKTLSPTQYFAYLLFFPTISSGPIDRYRRFGQDWVRQRTRAEFFDDLDFAIARVFRGFLYKFIVAALLHAHWVAPLAKQTGFLPKLGLMYADTLYLFFDFAGYSAFAVGLSRLFGIKTPENFDAPFLSRNIKDFWTRWHISLSFWFRDHVFMRFQLAAAKGKWFAGKHTANYVGLFVTFGLMGLWHGLALHYILYGLYHAALLCGYDWFARWNKRAKRWGDGPFWRAGNIVLTFHAFAFGILLFNGRLTPHAPPPNEEIVEKVDCHEVVGVLWDRAQPGMIREVDIYVDFTWVARVPAQEFRDDLRERGLGDGRHGFRYALPPYVRDGHSHTIEVRLPGSNREIRGSPEVIACDRE
jgi:membrane protein involved in D-alanine export